MTPPSSLKDRVRAEIDRSPSPTRAAVRRRLVGVLVIALALDALVVRSTGPAGLCNPGHRPAPYLWLALTGSLGIALAAAWRAFGFGGSMLGRSRRELVLVSLVTPFALSGWVLLCAWAFPESVSLPPRAGVRCFGLSLAFALWPVVALNPARPEWTRLPRLTGAARGVAIGAGGWLPLLGWCPRAGLAHLTVGHLAPLAVLALLGAWRNGASPAARSVTA